MKTRRKIIAVFYGRFCAWTFLSTKVWKGVQNLRAQGLKAKLSCTQNNKTRGCVKGLFYIERIS